MIEVIEPDDRFNLTVLPVSYVGWLTTSESGYEGCPPPEPFEVSPTTIVTSGGTMRGFVGRIVTKGHALEGRNVSLLLDTLQSYPNGTGALPFPLPHKIIISSSPIGICDARPHANVGFARPIVKNHLRGTAEVSTKQDALFQNRDWIEFQESENNTEL